MLNGTKMKGYISQIGNNYLLSRIPKPNSRKLLLIVTRQKLKAEVCLAGQKWELLWLLLPEQP